jgi:hypothetical protein
MHCRYAPHLIGAWKDLEQLDTNLTFPFMHGNLSCCRPNFGSLSLMLMAKFSMESTVPISTASATGKTLSIEAINTVCAAGMLLTANADSEETGQAVTKAMTVMMGCCWVLS